LLLLACVPAVLAEDEDEDEAGFEVATIYFEMNHTDGDLGIHALIDGEGWKILEIESPDEQQKLKVMAKGSLRQHGMTELFFESAEPSFDELDPEEFFGRFMEGEWEVSGVTIEGDELESTAWLSHVMAAPPEGVQVSGMPFSDDCDEYVPLVSEPVIISWDPVTSSHPEVGATGPIDVEAYQLVVEIEEPESLVFSVWLPPDVTEFELPVSFLDLGDEFKFEIVVREASGNQTALESCFELN
jgi:hypothetical protein